MGEWSTVQLSPAQSPLGQVLVHQRSETIIVVPLQEMDHFVDGDVFQTADRLLGQLQIEPDSAGIHVAASPLGFHLLDSPVVDAYAQSRLPFLQERRDQ